MGELHICRGLPGSGKTTFARQWVDERPSRRARVNRDDVRKVLHAVHAGRPTEDATTLMCHASMRQLLRKGWDVICDDTNLNAGNVRTLLAIAEQCGADVVWHDFDLDPDEAKHRDRQRGPDKWVGPAVIDKFARYLIGGHLPPRPEIAAAPKFAPYVAKPGTRPAVIVDIDGTLAHNYGHRSFYDVGPAILKDAVHAPILELLWSFTHRGYTAIVMSGRDEACRELTVQWLNEACGLSFDYGDYVGPFMRAAGDKRDDAIVKLELFDAHVRDHFDIRYVLDDRDRVVKAWRSIGLTVLQVADGDF